MIYAYIYQQLFDKWRKQPAEKDVVIYTHKDDMLVNIMLMESTCKHMSPVVGNDLIY